MTSTDSTWRQLTLTCDDWRAAEQVGIAVLGPQLTAAQDTGTVASWWFIRKAETWKIRLESPREGFPEQLSGALLSAKGACRVTETIYEPETTRFGGPDGMDVAHRLFAADSRCLLAHLARNGSALQRELPVVLATRMLRAAWQDWYEQGDCWEQLAAHRHDDRDFSPEPDAETIDAVRTLLTGGTDTPDSPLRGQPDWPGAFEYAGRHIAALASRGVLTRGQRAVLAQHMIFMFNRHGVPRDDQCALASAACRAVFGNPRQEADDTPRHTGPGTTAAATVAAVTTIPDTIDEEHASELRSGLADWISSRGTFQSPQVEKAFRKVSRHDFLPGIPLEEAYSRKPVVTRRAPDGTSLSSASSPNLVASMLEQLQAGPGCKVLEIGTATGFNAALLSELTAPGGMVVTIEIDGDLAEQATANLRHAGYPDVRVIAGDGALGHEDEALYDRIIVTAEATDITDPWWDQLATDGRIVAPVRLHGSGLTRSLALRRTSPDTMTADSTQVCGFVPMRGASEEAGQRIRLHPDAVLKVDAADLPDAAALADALDGPRTEHWTGIRVRDDDPAEHLDLWLSTMLSRNTDAAFAKLSVTPQAREQRIADPAMRWAGAGLYHGGTLAWITARPLDDTTNELGIDARGPDRAKLADTALGLLTEWDRLRPAQPVITAARAGAESPVTGDGLRVARPMTTFTVAW